MFIDFLLDVFEKAGDDDALVWNERTTSYAWLLDKVIHCRDKLGRDGVADGDVVSLEADFSPLSVALLLALIDKGCTVVPLTDSVDAQKDEFREIAEIEAMVTVDDADRFSVSRRDITVENPLLLELKSRGHPGLILFSSGSTGKSKAALHDFLPMLEKFRQPRHSLRAITFLLFDHIGGLNTLLYNLSNGGCIVTVSDRQPATICAAIEKHKVQLLPTSPTFINLLLVSRAYENHDLSSLELVTYGTEVMPAETLRMFNEAFPDIRMLQTYGLSEVGILRSKSRSSDSLWVKVGGEGFQTRVVEGLLEIKAESSMLGYLNAPSPFTDDGWFVTGDAVEVDGEYIKILGRKSEVINVGGEKVYPAEVEGALLAMRDVEDAVVCAEANAITGNVIVAKVRLASDESLSEFRKRMRLQFQGRPRYQVPQKVELVEEAMHGERFKKLRKNFS